MSDAGFFDELAFNGDGLLPAVAIDATTGRFLMLAWMNREALETTLEQRQAVFFSRSRQRLWRKGETSGHTLALETLRLDCDGDTIVLEVTPAGPACHTGESSCAFRRAAGSDGEWKWTRDEGPAGAPAAVVDRVYAVARARRTSSPDKSYTRSLFDGGIDKILSKVAEEHLELVEELMGDDTTAIAHECADLLFHLLVALAFRGIEPSQVWRELERRFGESGHAEKRRRTPRQ